MISGLAKANEKRNYRNKNNVEDRQTQYGHKLFTTNWVKNQ